MKLNTMRLSSLIAIILMSLVCTQSSHAMENIEEKWKGTEFIFQNKTSNLLTAQIGPTGNFIEPQAEATRQVQPWFFDINNDPETKTIFPYIIKIETQDLQMAKHLTITFLFNDKSVHAMISFNSDKKTFDFNFDDLDNMKFTIILGDNLENSTIKANINKAAIQRQENEKLEQRKKQLQQEGLNIQQKRLQPRPETTIEKLLELQRK